MGHPFIAGFLSHLVGVRVRVRVRVGVRVRVRVKVRVRAALRHRVGVAECLAHVTVIKAHCAPRSLG